MPSIGSSGEGADMLMVGVDMGTTRALNEVVAEGVCVAAWGLSVLVAIGTGHLGQQRS